MGFFNELEKSKREAPAASLELLHKMGCILCPLSCQAQNLSHPHMRATGSRNPLVYIIGEAPGKNEDKLGEQFVGAAGETLKLRLPDYWLVDIRWNNVVRCRPPGNRTPNITEMECCRHTKHFGPSITEDIENTQPAAIFGFGNVPLLWATGIPSGITKWAGRKIPVRIGNHTCWFFPMVHPSAIMRGRRTDEDGNARVPRNEDEYGSDEEFAFALNVRDALRQVEEGLPTPRVHTAEQAKKNVQLVYGADKGDLGRVRDFLNHMHDEHRIGIDYETSDPHMQARPYHEGSKILSVAVSGEYGTMAIGLDHPGCQWNKADHVDVWDEVQDFLLNFEGEKVSHSLPFELEWSAHFFGRRVVYEGKWGCSLSQAYILDERQGANKLNDLCITYFGLDIKSLSNLDRTRLDNCDIKDVLLYNGIDAKYHRHLYFAQEKELGRQRMEDVYKHQVRRLKAICLTQMKGVPVDPITVKSFLKTYDKKISETENKLHGIKEVRTFKDKKNRDFNPGSHIHVKDVMRKLGYEITSTDEKVLDKIDEDFARLILEYRGYAKLKSTYIEPLLPNSPVLFPGNRLHPIIKTTSVRTWRTASADPNCFPGDVEVLTSNGWLCWSEVSETDRLAQYDLETCEIDFTEPNELIVHDFNGKLKHISSGLHLDIICTKNHRFALRYRGNKKYLSSIRWVDADSFVEDYKLPQAGIFNGGWERLRQSQVTIISAFQADAYASKEYGYVEWGFTRKRKKDRLRAALKAEGINFRERAKSSDPRHTKFYIPRKDVPTWLVHKKHYGPWVLDLDKKTLQALVDELWHWDGGFTRKNEFCTGNIEDANWVQIILLLTNRRAAIRKRHGDNSKTLFVGASKKPYSMTTNFERADVYYNGPVYCATMPKGTLIVRYNGLVAITGNSQNFPKHGEAKEIRRQIKDPDGRKCVAFDYAGIQARNVAMESKDKTLVTAFWDDYDIHSDWSKILADLHPNWIKEGMKEFRLNKDLQKVYRQLSKNLYVFPSFFGAGYKSKSASLGVPEDIVRRMDEVFWRRFPRIKDWQDRTRRNFLEYGYVTGLSGFKRHAPVAGTEIINTPIQSDESIIVLGAMSRLSEMRKDCFQPNMEIHDDLTFFWYEDEIKKYAETVAKEMTRLAFPWMRIVPIVVEMSVGDNWADLKEVAKFSSVDLWGHKRT